MVEATFTELSKADDLFCLAVRSLSPYFKRSGDVKDAPTLSGTKGVIGTEYVTSDKDETRVGNLRKTHGSIVEEFGFQVLPERLRVEEKVVDWSW
jgi:hypothetical protein